MRHLAIGLVMAGLCAGSAQAALHIQFDYRYDQQGFFDDPLRREALEAAARFVNRYVDELAAVIPSDDQGTLALVSNPATGSDVLLRDEPLPAGTLTVFPAGRQLRGRLAQAIEYGPQGIGDDEWKELVSYRGQAGAAVRPATDYGPSGSSISFNSDLTEVPWHFDLTTNGLNANEFDFITVAMHELIHVMGLGVSHSFADQVNGSREFQGAQALSVGSSTNPMLVLNDQEDHWRAGTKSPWNGALQEALLAPGIFPGRRAFPTRLDRATLIDIGWEEASPGDANRDRVFNTTDLVDVFQAGLYETDGFAGWADGDWNDNAVFESGDLLTGLQTGTYEQAPAFSIDALGGESTDPFVELVYDRDSGDLTLDANGQALTGFQLTSRQNLFLVDAAQDLDGPFDVDRPDKLFLMRLGGFMSWHFGAILPSNLSLGELADDLSIQGAWLSGGSVEPQQVRLIPEPHAVLLVGLGAVALAWIRRRGPRAAR